MSDSFFAALSMRTPVWWISRISIAMAASLGCLDVEAILAACCGHGETTAERRRTTGTIGHRRAERQYGDGALGPKGGARRCERFRIAHVHPAGDHARRFHRDGPQRGQGCD